MIAQLANDYLAARKSGAHYADIISNTMLMMTLRYIIIPFVFCSNAAGPRIFESL